MTRVPITEAVLDQLETVLEAEEVEDRNARFTVQAIAMEAGHDELATFVAEADAVRYTRALELLDRRER